MNTSQFSSGRACPICENRTNTLFATEKIDENKLNKYSYSSRKSPEFMRLKLVKCDCCDCVYAPEPPEGTFLEQAYNEASYDSSMEADCAAESYATELKPFIKKLPHKNLAVDVGAGNGALLPHLKLMGFQHVIGVEPSKEAIKTAPDAVRDNLVEGMFSADLLPDEPLSLFCSFATLEHVASPLTILKEAYDLLKPGGMVAVSTHNYQGTLNRILGLKSPIIDIEHLQLYCPKTMAYVMERCGFTNITIQPIVNRYPMRYWLRLLPLPLAMKDMMHSALKAVRCENIQLSFPVGNMLTVAHKM